MIRVAIIGGKVHSGGKKNLIMEYYRHIDRNLVQFDFICDIDSNSIPEEEIIQLGGRVYKIASYHKIFHNMIGMYKIFKKNNYHAVHGWNGTMDVFAMFVAWVSGCRVRITESISTANRNEKKTLLKYTLRPFSKIFSTHYMANGVEAAIFQFGKKKYERGCVEIFRTVIDAKKNNYDEKLRNETRKQLGWEQNSVYGFIGRFVPQKNPIFLMEIFGAISKKQPEARFAIIGFGELEGAMNKRAKELGFFDKMINFGRREDIKKFYNAFDAFILPSLYEGLPVVGVEAQCTGLPIFMSTEVPAETKACDLAYFISLKNNPEKWADLIIPVTNENKKKRVGMVSEVIASGFDSEESAKRLGCFYANSCKTTINM